MKLPNFKNEGWIQTDERQFIKVLTDGVFKIYDEKMDNINGETQIFFDSISLNHYTDVELDQWVKREYQDLDSLKTIYSNERYYKKDDWKLVVAKLIAEQSPHEYTLG